MPGLQIDLNDVPYEPGDWYPVDWDDIVEYAGPANQLDYDMVWDDGSEGAKLQDLCLLIYCCFYL
jgi:hypothetical protein